MIPFLKTTLVVAFLFLIQTSEAQILRIDKNHLSSDTSGYTVGSVDLSFSANNRNSNADEQVHFLGTKAGLDLIRTREESATIWIGTINYTKLGDGPFISNGSGHLRHVFKRRSTLTPETYIQLQYDRSRQMQLRQLYGGGMRWNMLNKGDDLYSGLGLINENEVWDFEGEEIERNIWKLNSFIGSEINLTKRIIFNAILYFQSGEDKISNLYRSRASGFFEIKDQVTKNLEAKISAEFTWDQRPIIPLNQWVYEVYFGLEYDF